jgi:hypothetical protein
MLNLSVVVLRPSGVSRRRRLSRMLSRLSAAAPARGARYHGMEHSVAFTLVLQESAANGIGCLRKNVVCALAHSPTQSKTSWNVGGCTRTRQRLGAVQRLAP